MIQQVIPIFTTDHDPKVLFPITNDSVTAARHVFSVGELCEAILLHTDPIDIVRCRAVNRKLFETVAFSKSLRQKIFLEPDPTREPRSVNSLAPSWFSLKPATTIGFGVRLDLYDLWTTSLTTNICPLWRNMFISQPPPTSCAIDAGGHMTVFYTRYYPNGMTFGDLEKAVIAAFEIRKGQKSSPARLNYLAEANTIIIYWPSRRTS